MTARMCLLLSFSVTLLAGAVHAGAAAGGETAKILAADLERGEAAIIGKLRQPLGTPSGVAGRWREPGNPGRGKNVLVVDEVSVPVDGQPIAMALSMGVELEVRGVQLEKGKRYRLSGYESGEFVAIEKGDIGPEERKTSLQFRTFFVVTKVLEPVTELKRVGVTDIKIAFAKQRVAPSAGVPKAARNAGVKPDTTNQGPLAKRVDGKIAGLNVTWADPEQFSTETLATDFLRRRLSSRRGHSYTFQVWSQMLGVPMLAADLEHVGGKPGRLLIWPNGETAAQDGAALYVYLDGDGHWWFGDWDDWKANGGEK